VSISSAFAQAMGGGAGDSGLIGLLPIILMFGLLYFLMIRPQMKRAKEQRQMIEGLQKGDEVVTSGGMVGRITKLADAYITLEIAPDTEVHVQKAAVSTLLPKGTLKTIQ
jgi:preprotein translocase subunit YajC